MSAPSLAWQSEAACQGKDPALWFPSLEDGDNHGRQAKAICQGCPVRSECLSGAVERNEQYGVHGGAGEHELRKLRRAWLVDGSLGGPVWLLAMGRHFRRLDRERVPVENGNGPGATHGIAVTYSRGCRCAPCCWAARDRAARPRRRRRQEVAA